MKKLFLTVILMCCLATAGAHSNQDSITNNGEHLKFSYTANIDLSTAWLWRGLYCGGISAQPMATIGWESEHTSFQAGAWLNIGAMDGQFTKEDNNVNGEVDVIASLNIWGATIGFTHYNYWGRNYLWGEIGEKTYKYQNEVTLGYDFSTLLGVPVTFMWNTIIDDKTCTEENTLAHYSTYVECAYSHDFMNDWNLTAKLGFTPWKSQYTNYEGDFAITNIYLRGSKTWHIGKVCDMGIWAQAMVNPYYIGTDASKGIFGAFGYSVSF